MKKREEWKKTFTKIMIGQSISLITSSIVQYAIIWYITYETNSAFWLSLSTLIGFLPQGILGLFIGSFIDRNNRKRIMIYSDSFIAFVSLIMVIYGFFNNLPIWLIFICLGLRSVGAAFHSPSLQASIPLIVPEESMLQYSGYSQSLQSLSLIISPAIAALLYGKMNLSYIILLDVIGTIIAVFTLLISNIPNPRIESQQKENFLNETKQGLKLIVNNKLVRYIFIIITIYTLLYMPISSLFPLMTVSYFEKTTFHAGVVETVFAIGMLIGGFILANTKLFRNKRKNMIISILIMGIAIFISGIVTKNMYWIFVILSFIMGFSGPITQGTITTVFAEQIDPNYLGRLYSNYMSLTVLIMPIGLLISGSLADVVKINNWFLITGMLIMTISTYMITNKISFDKEKQ